MKTSIRSPLPWLGGLLAVYLLAPLAALVFAVGPGLGAGMREPGLWSATGISAAAASVSAVAIAVLGVPLGYLLARGRSRWLRPLEVLVQLPLAIPPLASGILLLFLVGPYTPLGRLSGGALTDSFTGIVLAQTFVAAPFLVVAARSAFAAVDPDLEAVAATLGHTGWNRFWRVSLPLAWPGIQAGGLLAWVRAFGEFGATVTLAYHPYSLPVYTFVQFGSTGLTAALPPVLAALLAAVLFLAASRLGGRRRRRPAPPEPGIDPVPPRTGEEQPLRFDVTRRIGGFDLHTFYRGSGRRVVVVGPSGSGKSLTLRLLAGLERPSAGFVALGPSELGAMPAEERGIGYVPQDYALFPHLTVWQQVTFGVGTEPALAWHWLRSLGIAPLRDRLPRELSGGQRQRVALARALARTPGLLLLDEPLSALDAPERDRLRRVLRAVQREAGVTTVVVTHDPQEAVLLGEDLVVLSEGRVLQEGRAADVLRRPATPEVAALLGLANVFPGTSDGPARVVLGPLALAVRTDLPAGTDVICRVPPDAVRLAEEGEQGVPARVLDAYQSGPRPRCYLGVHGMELAADLDGELPAPGTTCGVRIDAAKVEVWPAPGPARP